MLLFLHVILCVWIIYKGISYVFKSPTYTTQLLVHGVLSSHGEVRKNKIRQSVHEAPSQKMIERNSMMKMQDHLLSCHTWPNNFIWLWCGEQRVNGSHSSLVFETWSVICCPDTMKSLKLPFHAMHQELLSCFFQTPIPSNYSSKILLGPTPCHLWPNTSLIWVCFDLDDEFILTGVFSVQYLKLICVSMQWLFCFFFLPKNGD